MKKTSFSFFKHLFFQLCVALLMISLVDGSANHAFSAESSAKINALPLAQAGTDQQVGMGTVVTLDASASTDTDGQIVAYSWAQLSGRVVRLSGKTSAQVTFVAPPVLADKVLTFRLQVKDDSGIVSTDTVKVTVKRQLDGQVSLAQAGADQQVEAGTTVTLDGSTSGEDADGQIVAYNWAQLKGRVVRLSDKATAKATFVAPFVDSDQVLTFWLQAKDDSGVVGSDIVSITVKKSQAPQADAGVDQQATVGAVVTLDAGSSKDADGQIVSYAWAQKTGRVVNLSGKTSAQATFVVPPITTDQVLTFRLQVKDNSGAIGTDLVNVSIKKQSDQNQAPLAQAGADQQVDGGAVVTLDGSASKDTDGQIVSYAWAQLTGRVVNLSGKTSQQASFTAPVVTVDETLTFRLQVKDDAGAVSSDVIAVTLKKASIQNQAPIANAGTDQQVAAGATVTLDGNTSKDTDGQVVSYAWAQLSGQVVALSGETSVQASFAAPAVTADETLAFRLQVKDNLGAVSNDTVLVKISPSVTLPPSTGALNDTGITQCMGTGGQKVSCPVAAGVGQDAEFGRDKSAASNSDGHAGFSLSKMGENGQALPQSASQWACVKDNVTGLLWEVKSQDGGLRDINWNYSWYEPDNKINGGWKGTLNRGLCAGVSSCDTYNFVQAVNQQGLCGQSKWRLPTRAELRSLVRYDRSNPTINVDFFPETKSLPYWSSSPYAQGSYGGYVWSVYFLTGMDNFSGTVYNYPVRLVYGD